MAIRLMRDRVAVVACLLALAGLSPDARAQQGTPPGTIYYLQSGNTWSMNGAGGGKTDTVDGQPTYQRHDGSRWSLQIRDANGVGAWGQWFAVDESGGAVQLTNDPDLHWNGVPPSWAKDDSFFSYAGVYETETEWIGRLFVVAVNWIDGTPVAGEPTMVLELRRSVFDEWGQWSYEGLDEVDLGRHDWSPAGDTLAVTRWVWGTGWIVEIVGFTATGIDVRTLATKAANPEWSPDGSRLAFNREERSGYQEIRDIWTIKPDGTDAVRLTTYIAGNGSNGTSQYLPTWSPDGVYLAYTERVIKGNKTTSNILRIRATGGSKTNLTSDGKSSWPRWRP